MLQMSYALRRGTRANDNLVADNIRTKTLSTDNINIHTLHVENDASISGKLIVDNDVDIKGDLSVSGDFTLDASLNIAGDLVVQGNLTVVNESTLSETTYIHNDIFYTVAQSIEQPATFLDRVTICGDLDVSGDASFNTIICHDQLRFPNNKIRITEDTTPFVNQGIDTIAIGREAGTLSQGDESIAIGHESGTISQGDESVAVGHQAGQSLQGTQSVAVGHQSAQTSQGVGSVAVGYYSGVTNQGNYAVAVGRTAAQSNQGLGAVAVGNAAGDISQGTLSVAVGYFAGYDTQGTESVAVGHQAGRNSQGQYAVAVGFKAGLSGQADNSIVLNAQSTKLDSTTSGFFVKPVREQENTVGWTPPGTLWYEPSTGELASQPDISQGTIAVDLTISGSLGINRDASDGNVLDVSGDGRVRGDFRVDGSFNIGPASVTMWEDACGNLTMAHSAASTAGININLHDPSNTAIDSGDSSRGILIGPKDVSASTIHISKDGKIGIGKRIEGGDPTQYKTVDVSGDIEIDGKLFIHGSEIGISGMDTHSLTTREIQLYNLSDDDAAIITLTTFENTYDDISYDRVNLDLTHGTICGEQWVSLSDASEHTLIQHSTVQPTIHARLPPNHGWYGTKLHHVNYDLMCDTESLDTTDITSYGVNGRDFAKDTIDDDSEQYASFDVVLPAWEDSDSSYNFPEGTSVVIYGKGLARGPNNQRTFLRLIVPGYDTTTEEGNIHLNFSQISPDISYGLAKYIDEEDPGEGASALSRIPNSNSIWFDLTSVPPMRNLEMNAWMRDSDGGYDNQYPDYAPGTVGGFTEDNTKCIWKCECVSTTHGWVIDRFTITNGDGNTTIPQNLIVKKDATVTGTLTIGDNLDVSENLGVSGNAVVDGTLGVGGDVTIDGTLGVGGDVTMDASAAILGNLGVSGNAVVDGTLDVGDQLEVSGGNIVVRYAGGNALTFLTGGSSDIRFGYTGVGTDCTGYIINGNTGSCSDFGLSIYGLDGTDTTSNTLIGQFYSPAVNTGKFAGNRHGLYIPDLINTNEITVNDVTAQQTVTVANTSSYLTEALILNNGDGSSIPNLVSQITFGYARSRTFRHFIVTEHHGSDNTGNNIYFYTHDYTQGSTAGLSGAHMSMIVGTSGIFINEELEVSGNGRITGNLQVDGTFTNFTGGHYTTVLEDISKQHLDGLILSSTGKPLLNPTDYTYLMYMNISKTSHDTKCAGIYQHTPKRETGICVAIGEGTVWVCEENGPIANGDYITTSSIPGFGMRQDSTQLHNYTVAKAYTNCDFNPLIEIYSVPKTEIITTTKTQKKMTIETISEAYEEVVEISGYVDVPLMDSSGRPILDSSGNPILEHKWFDKIEQTVTKYREKEVQKVNPIQKTVAVINEDGVFQTFKNITEYEMETITISNEEPVLNDDGTPVMEDISEEAYVRKWVQVYDTKYVIYNDEEQTDVYSEYPFEFLANHPEMVGNTYRCARIGCTYHCG